MFVFPFSSLKMLGCFQYETCGHLYLCSSVYNVVLFFLCLYVIFLSADLSNMIMMRLGVGFFFHVSYVWDLLSFLDLLICDIYEI